MSEEKPVPKSFYEWCMLCRRLRLKVGPYETFKDEVFTHALRPGTQQASFGMWDHKTNSGYIAYEKLEAGAHLPRAISQDGIRPAPPIPDGDKEWDM
jgi:hypothetical protein